jgi:serine/threonine protein kinase
LQVRFPEDKIEASRAQIQPLSHDAAGPRVLIGRTLAHYRITAAIGAGGMGEVYRATDPKLGRDVAIKVLPSELARDPERLARFEREAKLLASLNHPNIAHVYGFESATLEDDSTAHFLAMELVEGEDLSERLKRGAIPVDETLEIAKQIAEALEEAHEHGIVHRDLKPANVKVTPDGKVKVLDFGLAKAFTDDPTTSSSGDVSHSPTLSAQGTRAGMILGTAAYMSPEQARGKAVDKRADIWAFGVVLYEMLTGKRLFSGETASDVLAGVLKTEIDFAALPAEAPSRIRRLLRECLERNPRNRLHDMADARLAIDDALAGAREDGLSPATASERAGWRHLVPWALAAVAASWAAWATLRTSSSEGPHERLRVAFTVPWQAAGRSKGTPRSVTLSRDGRRLMIWNDANETVLLRDLEHFGMRAVPLPAHASAPFLSPDGLWVGFNADGKLQKVALAGGDPVKLCDSPNNAPGGTWGADGFIYFTPGWNSGLWRVPERGGSPEQLSTPDKARPGSFHGWPSPLPDGRGVVFTMWGGAGVSDARIAYFDARTREVSQVADGAAAQYVTTGDIVFFRHGSWLAAPFDPHARKLGGPERRVLGAARPLYPVGGREQSFSFSDDGRLAYIAAEFGTFTPYTQLAWIDRSGHVDRLPFEGPHEYRSLALSRDDRRAAVSLAQEGELQVWIDDLVGGTRERLTRDGQNLDPSWAPDGPRLAVTSLLRGNFDIRLFSADAVAPPTDLVATPTDDDRVAWTPDGRAFVYAHSSAQTGVDIWSRAVDETGAGKPVVVTPDDDEYPSLSPDGRFLAYRSHSALYVTSFPESGERTKIAESGSPPSWSPSSPEIFVIEGGRMMSIRYEISGGRFRTTDSRALFDVPLSLGDGQFAVSHDARRFLMLVPVSGKTLDPEVRVVTDGFAELRAAGASEAK